MCSLCRRSRLVVAKMKDLINMLTISDTTDVNVVADVAAAADDTGVDDAPGSLSS